MSGFNNHQDDEQIPNLIPLQKKKVQHHPIATPSEKNSVASQQLNTIIKQTIKNTPTNQLTKDNDRSFNQNKKIPPTQEKVQEIEKRGKDRMLGLPKKQNQASKIQSQRIKKQNEKMKTVIAQMLTGMAIKSGTQELYPVSNQTIRELLDKIQEEITELTNDVEKREASLVVNQNNQHVRNEIKTSKKQIEHCSVIKQLYHQKMNYRNKIHTLEETIGNLKNENKDLKNKVSRGIQTIENYKHNLPCDREKQLQEKLNTTTQQLGQEKQMRINLQKNIQSIIMNFKRLYEQADSARQIVTKKLKEVEEREKRIRKMKEFEEQENSNDSSPRRINSLDVAEDGKKNLSNSNNHLMESNVDFSMNSRKNSDMDNRKTQLKPKMGRSFLGRDKQEKRAVEQINTSMTMQERIKKMKSNQTALSKIFV